MGYTPTNWQNGDVLSVEKLNKIENGIANATEPLNADNQVQISYGVDSYGEIFSETQSITFADAMELYRGSKVLVAQNISNYALVYMSNVGYAGNYMFFKGFHADLSAGLASEFGVVLYVADEEQPASVASIMWADKPFVVICNPASQDYSGTMDKTVAEIDAAYKMGLTVLFRVLTGASSYAEAQCSISAQDSEDTYPSYGGFTIDAVNNILIYAYTPYVDDGTFTSYFTSIYPLTPMT